MSRNMFWTYSNLMCAYSIFSLNSNVIRAVCIYPATKTGIANSLLFLRELKHNTASLYSDKLTIIMGDIDLIDIV